MLIFHNVVTVYISGDGIMKVKQLVNKNYKIFFEDTPYLKVLRKFEEEKIEFSIIKSYADRITGIITPSDLFRVAFPGYNEANGYSEYTSFKNFISDRNKNLYNKPIKDIMTNSPEFVYAEQTVFEAAAIMKAFKIKQLAVFNGQEFVGVLTIHDLIKEFILVDKTPELKKTYPEIYES